MSALPSRPALGHTLMLVPIPARTEGWLQLWAVQDSCGFGCSKNASSQALDSRSLQEGFSLLAAETGSLLARVTLAVSS